MRKGSDFGGKPTFFSFCFCFERGEGHLKGDVDGSDHLSWMSG
jgi:hypothetical protein